ncbi:MAG: UDP-4-amino-4,6-dideoxy-N-acetyl-beta-L-altrosamine transaminase [Alphaproteobacteria bacterium]|nr:UDP-4-amino-4,6-dideoxy-N-acetyl-beta-L-altrosamine transaminase [Alphaproteobacteria bacterium]
MIPYSRQNINEDDISAVTEVLRGDFLTTGPKIKEFEDAICEITNTKYAIACSNGTIALHLAGIAFGLKEGDAVIVPSVTFLATANAARYCGAEVMFSDVDPDSGLMQASDLEHALKRCKDLGLNPRAVFPVHLTGQCVNIEEISKTAKASGLKILTDAAHAIGGELHGKPVGSCDHEDACAFSFHPVKTIATGEGGAVTTNDAKLAAKMRTLRHHSMQTTPKKGAWCYEMEELGYNYRITDIQCALGISQLKRLGNFVARRRELVALYDKLLEPLAPVLKPPPKMQYCNPGWHLYAVKIDFAAANITRQNFMAALHDKGIGTQVHYIPVHTQPYYKKRYGNIELPGAESYYEQTLSLPLYPTLRNEDIHFIVNEITKAIQVKNESCCNNSCQRRL